VRQIKLAMLAFGRTLIYVVEIEITHHTLSFKRIRGFTTMRYIKLRFTYLLT